MFENRIGKFAASIEMVDVNLGELLCYIHWLWLMPVLTNSSSGFFESLIPLTQSQHASRTTRTLPSMDDRTTDGSA